VMKIEEVRTKKAPAKGLLGKILRIN